MLLLEDKDLNSIVSLKKLAPYRDKEWHVPEHKLRPALEAARKKVAAEGRKRRGREGRGKEGRRESRGWKELRRGEESKGNKGGEEGKGGVTSSTAGNMNGAVKEENTSTAGKMNGGGGGEGQQRAVGRAAKKNLKRKAKRQQAALLAGADGKQPMTMERLKSYGDVFASHKKA